MSVYYISYVPSVSLLLLRETLIKWRNLYVPVCACRGFGITFNSNLPRLL